MREFNANSLKDLQSQMLAVLVMDLGYDHRPLYGHDPMRHQNAWSQATFGRTREDVAAQVDRCIAQNAREGGIWAHRTPEPDRHDFLFCMSSDELKV